MTRGIRIACAVAFLAALSALASPAELQVAISTERAEWGVGEPIAVDLALSNVGAETLYVQRGVLMGDALAESILVLRIVAEGTQDIIVADVPSSAPPPTLAPVDGVGAPVWVAATTLLPGASLGVSIPNLLRWFPFLAAGEYEVLALVQVPAARSAEEDAEGGFWIELGAAEDAVALSAALRFRVVAPQGPSEGDLARLAEARASLNRATSAEGACASFATLAIEAVDRYVQACAAYWVGEAYSRFGRWEDAAAAYLEAMRRFPDSVFRTHAERRLGELAQGASGG
ncbi:MAG: hypothetical protein AB1778_01685 [Candidatus Bipolaricaulota bacterium]